MISRKISSEEWFRVIREVMWQVISRNLSISRKNSEYFSDFMTVGIKSRIEENIDFTENSEYLENYERTEKNTWNDLTNFPFKSCENRVEKWFHDKYQVKSDFTKFVKWCDRVISRNLLISWKKVVYFSGKNHASQLIYWGKTKIQIFEINFEF